MATMNLRQPKSGLHPFPQQENLSCQSSQLTKGRRNLGLPPFCSRGRSIVSTPCHDMSACTCIRSFKAFAALSENVPGRVDTLVDAGVKINNVEFIPDILDCRYRENNRAAPPPLPIYLPLEENGPNEFDFEIYASNCTVNYEPPPPPHAPFSFPFEDYYGEVVGVDYISKEEVPANSLFQLLHSLKMEEGKEDTINGEKHSSFSSILQASKTAEEESQGSESAGRNLGTTSDADGDFLDVVNGRNPSASSSDRVKESKHAFISNSPLKKMSGEPSVFSELKMSKASSTGSVSCEFQRSPDLISTEITNHERLDPDRYAPAHVVRQGQDFDSKNVEERSSNSLSSRRVVDEGNADYGFEFGTQTESESIAHRSSQIVSCDDNAAVPNAPDQQQIKGILRQKESDVTLAEAILPEYTEVNDLSGEWTDTVVSDQVPKHLLMAHVPDSSKGMASNLAYYVPQMGDLVIGAVTFINDQKIDLEIGAKSLALMPLRDLQPLLQHSRSQLFDLSGGADLSVPVGESQLLNGDIASNSAFSGVAVDIGTIFVAEVTGKTIIDGRAILSCKLAAQNLAWHRMEQLRCLGEAIQIEITQWNEGGLLSLWEGIRVFVPKSELLQKPNSMALLKTYVGSKLSVAVVKTDRSTFSMTASEVHAWMSKYLRLGTVHDVTVIRVQPYGMQVEIHNTKIRGFVHKSNFSREFVSSATNYFMEGDKAKAMLIRGRDSTKISFSMADLEKEDGLLLRNKEQVFCDAEEMGRRFRESFSGEDTRVYGMTDCRISLDYGNKKFANLAWLQI